jgi:ribulose kinase
VFLPQHSHSSVMGAAMLAGCASGAFSDLKQAASLLTPAVECLKPNAGNAATLDQSYRRYGELFAAVKSLALDPRHAHD